MSSRLIIFTRYPEPGATKTRLIPVLGPEGAAGLHRKMTEHTVAYMRDLWRPGSFGVEMRYDGGNETLMREWLGDDLDYRAQGDGNLGERMARAFREAFEEGSNRVVIVGTDCPDLNAEMVAEAFNALHRDDVAVGPASDGGYYLIGLRRPVPELFRDIRWGTDQVYKETMKTIERLHLEAFVMTTLTDVDRPEDLTVWRRWSEESRDAP